jgi:hypothetical protein
MFHLALFNWLLLFKNEENVTKKKNRQSFNNQFYKIQINQGKNYFSKNRVNIRHVKYLGRKKNHVREMWSFLAVNK